METYKFKTEAANIPSLCIEFIECSLFMSPRRTQGSPLLEHTLSLL